MMTITGFDDLGKIDFEKRPVTAAYVPLDVARVLEDYLSRDYGFVCRMVADMGALVRRGDYDVAAAAIDRDFGGVCEHVSPVEMESQLAADEVRDVARLMAAMPDGTRYATRADAHRTRADMDLMRRMDREGWFEPEGSDVRTHAFPQRPAR